MSFTHNLLPLNAVKFRETNADSVVFHMADHTPAAPATMTITRVLPKARKGNNGTMKVLVNVRRHVDIPVDGSEGTRSVPVICKLETSLPVGASMNDLRQTFVDLSRLVAVGQVDLNDDQAKIFQIGLLPDGSGSNAEISDEEG